jgi:hypothetical protein
MKKQTIPIADKIAQLNAKILETKMTDPLNFTKIRSLQNKLNKAHGA